MHGYEVYTTEVDDRGIDFIARINRGPFIEIQVKSLRSYGYVFMQKTKFEIRDHVYVALGLMFSDKEPNLFLIPATRWRKPDNIFVERNYSGLKSKPEWGINISQKNMQEINKFEFDQTIDSLNFQNGQTTGAPRV